LQLHLEGSYLATLRYLRALEALPWEFFWDGLHFEVIEYPTARVRLDIHTLGLTG
jgi:MSHA biogenesis protein MshJ